MVATAARDSNARISERIAVQQEGRHQLGRLNRKKARLCGLILVGGGSGGGEAASPGTGRTEQATRGRDSTSLAWLQENKRG